MDSAFLICNDASVDADGRLSIDGVYDELFAPGFPARQERLVVAGIVYWDAGEEGRIQFKIDLTGPEGAAVFTVEGYTEVSPQPGAVAPPKTQLVLPLENVVFNTPGCYRVSIDINGESLSGPALYVSRK